MSQKDLLEKLMAGKGLPYGWCYCFNEQCAQKEECVCFLSSQYLDAKRMYGNAVFPNAWRGGKCQMFSQLRLTKMAWGFDHLFKDVKVSDAQYLRAKVRGILGSKGQYYRYKLGQLKLKPELQEQILQVFRSHGYPDAKFDYYEDEIINY